MFDNDENYKMVMNIIIQSLNGLNQGELKGEELSFNLSDWMSYHFQSTCSPKIGEEDLRTVYQFKENLNVLGFGHRYIPSDFYNRFKSCL